MPQPNLTRPSRIFGLFPQPARLGPTVLVLDYRAAVARGFTGTEAQWRAALADTSPGPSPMRLMGISGQNADEHIWFTGTEPVWILVPVTDPDRTDPPTGEANDLAAFSGLTPGQHIHIYADIDPACLPLTAMSFWISEDHQDHWQTLVADVNGPEFEETITVPEPDEETNGRVPFYWGLGLWVMPLETHRNVTIRRLTISDGTLTYAWP